MSIINNSFLEDLNAEIKQNNQSTEKIQTSSKKEKGLQTKQNTTSTSGETNPTSYESFRKRWQNRTVTKNIQPYVDHIELFLGLISSEYNYELQQALAKLNLEGPTEEQKKGFIVQDSKVNFHWQVLDDRCELIDGAKVSNPFGIKSLFGTPLAHFQAIHSRNIRGANPCIAINKIEGVARKNTNVTYARAIWLEDDEVRTHPRSASDVNDPLPLPPSFIVESSRGKFHYYWLTYTDDLKTWERIQKQVMTEHFGSDPGANGLNRAMRIPGFWHSKKRGFPTRIVYMLGEDNYPIEAQPTKEFIEFAKNHQGVYEKYAFDANLANLTKRYGWEEILGAFERFLPAESLAGEYEVSEFDLLNAVDLIHDSEDYHGSLHSLCMHFANYKQDPEYVALLVQSLMGRVPEEKRDVRWMTRFNDIPRSAEAAVVKRLSELAQETLLPADVKQDINKLQEVGIHDENWHMNFPNITGIEPFDALMQDFGSGTGHPIKSFNFAAVYSFFCLCLQNIPIMPVKAQRTANGCHILLAPSTEGKDLNTTSPLKALRHGLLRRLLDTNDTHSIAIRNVLEGIRGNTGEITSLSAFHNWAGQKAQGSGGIWINTECTSQIAKMADENYNVANLAEIIINIQDGEPIPPVTKATTAKKDGVSDAQPLYEAFSVLFATQPASIKKHMTPSLLYKGVTGRPDYYVPDRPSLGLHDQISYISKTALRPIKWNKETLDFIIWMLKQCCGRVEGCTDGAKRRIAVVFEDNDCDPLAKEFKEDIIDGPRRQKFIDWDLKWHKDERYQLDQQFNTFADRIQMSVERWVTVFAAVEHLWKCFKNGKEVPFQDPIVISDKVLDTCLKLGDYQYEVRFSRIWPLVGSNRGLDGQHRAVLDAIKKADKSPAGWLRYASPNLKPILEHLFKKEYFVPINGVTRFLALDETILTKDLIPIMLNLQAMGLVEFEKNKQMDARITNKPVRNVVRLTVEGRQ